MHRNLKIYEIQKANLIDLDLKKGLNSYVFLNYFFALIKMYSPYFYFGL